MQVGRLLALDIAAIAAAFVLSFVLRLEIAVVWPYLMVHWPVLVMLGALKIAALNRSGLYRRLWRYASLTEATAIVRAITLASAIVGTYLLAVDTFSLGTPLGRLPRSIIIIDWLVSVALIGANRLGARIMAERRAARRNQSAAVGLSARRVLVAGAGDAGVTIVGEMQRIPALGMRPVGFVDDDTAKCGFNVRGLRVLGTCADIAEIVERCHIDEVVLAMPTAAGPKFRAIREACQDMGVACRTVPGLLEVLDGRVSVRQLRDISLDDLLRRAPASFGGFSPAAALVGKTVLVTGAGGSIGSELCRQIAVFQPGRLILLGKGENSIYHIAAELGSRFPHVPLTSVIASVSDAPRVSALFEEHRPQIIFHAAAHKHVHLMEQNPCEAVRNNVLGTRVVSQQAMRVGAQLFVLISSDKAVQPTSVMGASKRVAESIVLDLQGMSDTIFAAVRFGNVLGSRGSLVPILQGQIAHGGPVTVTHPDVTRFFMTIPEASKLVLQASALAKGGDLFVLDMGQPVRIVDIAHDLIKLAGIQPGHGIEVVFTGLRPGEKLHEKLIWPDEKIERTAVPSVHRVEPVAHGAPELQRRVDDLIALSDDGLDERVRRELLDLAGGGVIPAGRGAHQPCESHQAIARTT